MSVIMLIWYLLPTILLSLNGKERPDWSQWMSPVESVEEKASKLHA